MSRACPSAQFQQTETGLHHVVQSFLARRQAASCIMPGLFLFIPLIGTLRGEMLESGQKEKGGS